MYLLDTNVVSEIRKGIKADSNVLSWAKAVSTSSLFLSVITILELEAGVLQKERKDPSQGAILRSWLDSHVLPSFSDRVLNIDVAVALRCAKLHIPNPRSERDALITATALVHGLIIVTRNTKDFKETGVELFNPWE
ncbi:TPA: type II toxin-antitoxin system VapC family toxin [Legionella bozemanae]|uniref:Toxin FitB n=1 Tax=Legionella bozemanae TaxID=447 RepID=A0A0W0RJ17_LEGBO|nr:type II toxin-antitoxin system VapC family toxin [Legionella bozemanae]KTC71029.1 Toxin FitB [Legionella bozemanae]STO34699.1 Probable ribonuclease FitB [Legionella bozemanae]